MVGVVTKIEMARDWFGLICDVLLCVNICVVLLCVNIDLDRIRIWLAANKLTLNTTKTEFLLIGSRQRLSTLERNPQIEINKFPIKQVSTSKSLGVHIDGNLSWESHIKEISKKIASGISAIKRIRYFLPFEILLNVYNSLVQPH